MSASEVTREGVQDARPGRQAITGANVPPGGDGRLCRKGRRGEPELRTYDNLPVIDQPVWDSPDISGYLFLGGRGFGRAAPGSWIVA